MEPTTLETARTGRPAWVVVPAAVAVSVFCAAMTAAGYGGAAGLYSLLNAPSTTPKAPQEVAEIPEELPPPFQGWPQEAPDVVLVLTGEMHGYMRPCGCSAGQHGGLARRAGFLEYLKTEKKWDPLPLDLGDLVDRSGEMEMLRYHHTLRSLAEIGYPVVGVGESDLKLQVINLLGESMNLDGTELILANLDHADYKAALQDEWFKSVVVQERNGVKVGVSLLMAPGAPLEAGASLQSPDEAVSSILQQMNEKQTELKVLLAQMTFEEAKQLAEKHPGFDLILSRSEYEDSAAQEAEMVGDAMVTWVGKKGKAVGVVGVWKDQTPKLRFEMVALDTRFNEVDKVNDIYAQFVADVKNKQFLLQVPKSPPPHNDHYVGAKRCGECHARIYEHWKTTKHAHAIETLTTAAPQGQDYNPECVKCHVVGLYERTGFQTVDQTPHLGGVQCESCHGPGGMHADNKDNMKYRERVRRSRFDAKQQCIKCHDAENSVHFNFDTYWPQVAHP